MTERLRLAKCFSSRRWATRAGVLAVLGCLSLAACRTPRYRYANKSPREADVRDLEQLIADSRNPNAKNLPDVSKKLRASIVDFKFNAPVPEYRLGPQDVLNIFVAQHPEMSSQRVEMGQIAGSKIQRDGMVYLPVLGGIKAAGYTIVEFRKVLLENVAKYIAEPQVAVEVLEYKSQKCFVLGSVLKPGAFAVDGNITLLEGVGLAGGTLEQANLESAHVLRGGRLLPINLADVILRGDVSRNLVLAAGDVVYIPDSADQKVYVLGEVQKPSPVPIVRNRLTLAEALSFAGGPVAASSKREIAILRGGFAKPVVYAIDLEVALLYDEQILLRPGDRVVVAPTGLATASRYMQQILPFLQGAQSIGFAAQGATNIAAQITAASK